MCPCLVVLRAALCAFGSVHIDSCLPCSPHGINLMVARLSSEQFHFAGRTRHVRAVQGSGPQHGVLYGHHVN